MKRVMVVCLVGLLGACASTDREPRHTGALDIQSLVEVVPARIENPLPECEASVSYANLSQPRPLRGYLQNESSGALCKR